MVPGLWTMVPDTDHSGIFVRKEPTNSPPSWRKGSDPFHHQLPSHDGGGEEKESGCEITNREECWS